MKVILSQWGGVGLYRFVLSVVQEISKSILRLVFKSFLYRNVNHSKAEVSMKVVDGLLQKNSRVKGLGVGRMCGCYSCSARSSFLWFLVWNSVAG